MKKHIGKALLISLAVGFSVSSCEGLNDCKICRIITYVDGVETERSLGVVYCGDDLAEKENAAPVVVGNTTTQWECE